MYVHVLFLWFKRPNLIIKKFAIGIANLYGYLAHGKFSFKVCLKGQFKQVLFIAGAIFANQGHIEANKFVYFVWITYILLQHSLHPIKHIFSFNVIQWINLQHG